MKNDLDELEKSIRGNVWKKVFYGILIAVVGAGMAFGFFYMFYTLVNMSVGL